MNTIAMGGNLCIYGRPSVTVPYDVCALTAPSSAETATPTGGWADYMYILQHVRNMTNDNRGRAAIG